MKPETRIAASTFPESRIAGGRPTRRKLVNEASHSAKVDKVMPSPATGSIFGTSMLEEDISIDVTEASEPLSNEVGSPPLSSQLQDLSNSLRLHFLSTEKECSPIDDQASEPLSNEVGSLPLSSQLQDLSNSLRLRFLSTEKECSPIDDQISSDIEE